MAISWYTEQEAEKMFETTLIKWSKDFGYKGCYSPDEARGAVEATKRWAAKSSTAMNILDFVNSSDKEVIVVGMRGGF